MAAGPNSPKFPANPFWDFSIGVYGKDGVAPACLRLQDRHQMAVNILLFACWWGRAGKGCLTPDQFAHIQDRVGVWHQDAVRRLRAIRNDLKSDQRQAPGEFAEALRDQVKAGELYAERTEQLMLVQLSPELSPELSADRAGEPAGHARESAENYLHFLGAVPSGEDLADIALILSAAFGREKIN